MRPWTTLPWLLVLASLALAAEPAPDLEANVRTLSLAAAERSGETLERDPRLRELARQHSQAMYEQGVLGHELPGGDGPGERVAREHRTLFGLISENVAYQYNWPRDATLAERFLDGWMNSPGHRRNLLASYRVLEVGCHGDEVRFHQPPGATLVVRLADPQADSRARRLSVSAAGGRPEEPGVPFVDGSARLPLPDRPGLYELQLWAEASPGSGRYAIVGGPFVCISAGKRDGPHCTP